MARRIDDWPPARGARLPFVSDEQVLDHFVEPRMLFAAEPDIFMKRHVFRSPEPPGIADCLACCANAAVEFFTHFECKHGARFYLRLAPDQQYFRTTL